MAEFCVYKYEFEPTGQTWAFADENVKVTPELLRKVLGGALRGILPLQRKKRKQLVGTTAHVVANHDDIALLTVHNVVSLKQWREMQEKPNEIDSFPHCRVIVDNRKGVQQLVVEKSSQFSATPDVAMGMMERYMDNFLAEYSSRVNIVGKIHVGDVWNRVESEEERGHFVKKVEFVMGAREQVDDDGIGTNDLLIASAQWNRTVNAARSRFITEARKGHALKFAQAEEDCKRTVELCARNGYEIVVHFEQSSVYRSNNKKQTAYFPMVDMDYNDFRQGTPNLDGSFALVNWLDEIRRDDKGKFHYVKYEKHY